jgi:sugar phosphate isomerase/epimerase
MESGKLKDLRLGIIVDSFRIGIVEGIKKAAEIGAEGVQIYAVSGEMAPENLSAARRMEIIDIIRSNGLTVAALCGDLGGYGFANAEDNQKKIDKSCRIMELAKEMGSDIVTTHIGVVPADRGSKTREVMGEACEKLGEFAESMASHFAIETGPEKPAVLKSFLSGLLTKGIGVNYDPANLVMVTGDDPVEGVETLKDFIFHTHVKDGIMLKRTDPKIIYDYFALGGIEDMNLREYFLETPLGQGSVDFPAYLSALRRIGYGGFLTIEREVGETPEKDIRAAVDFLRNL